MSRQRTGERIQWRARLKTWVGRVRGEDGKRSPWTDLCSDDETVAQERYDRWLATGEPPSQSGKETFRAAAERVVDRQEARGEKGAGSRRQRIRDFAIPRIGHVEVARLEAHHVASVLDAMVGDDKKSGTILKMRTDISRILSALVREGAVPVNVARGVELPEDAAVDDRPRIVLTDAEILEFRRVRGFERELDMMALFARDLGGHRTSDLHAADWSDFDVGIWSTAKVRRPKTDGRRDRERAGKRRATRAFELVTHAIPPSVVAPLDAWWRAQGSPKAGPVFPLRKGKNAGQRKTGKGISYAEPLRDALWEARIHRPLPGFESAIGEARRKYDALQVDTEETRAVDFHSFRRAYGNALAQAGVNLQTAMDAMGHSTESAHHRYRSARLLELPLAALPGKGETLPMPPRPPGRTMQAAAALALAVATAVSAPAGASTHDLGQKTQMGDASNAGFVNDSAASPARIELATNALGRKRGPRKRSFPRGLPTRIRPRHRPAKPSLTHEMGQSDPPPLPGEEDPDSPLPLVPLAIGDHACAQKEPYSALSVDAPSSETEPAVTREPPRVITSQPDPLELLKASAKAALEEGNADLVRALLPLIEAEQKRATASAPVSLEVVRAKREGAK
jgi:hypothetical protein